ncbi:hypothetical protein AAVH_32638, partial [Aphelenchoides avenae]
MENGESVLYIYGFNETDTQGNMLFVDASPCSYDVVIELDRFSSIVKILRRFRERAVTSFVVLLLATAAYCITQRKWMLWALLAFIIAMHWPLPSSVAPVVLCTSSTVLLAWLRIQAGIKSFRVVLAGSVIFALGAHSFIPLVIASIANLFAVWSEFRERPSHFSPLAMLTLTIVVLQLPSGITYFWNLVKYHTVIAASNTFLDAALVSIAASFLSITPLNTTSVSVTRICSAIVFFIVVIRNPSHFFVVLDDLSTLCALSLVILWHTTGIDQASKVKSNLLIDISVVAVLQPSQKSQQVHHG